MKKERSTIDKRCCGVRLLCTCFCGICVYALVGWMALSGRIRAGEVVAAYAAQNMLILAFSELAQIITDLRNNNEHLLNFFRFMDLPEEEDRGNMEGNSSLNFPAKQDSELPKKENYDFSGICFEHVSFRYPGSKEWALFDICLKVKKGEKLALVGENGSGKTSFVKLLCRLYQPTKGKILLDGADIWSYPWEEGGERAKKSRALEKSGESAARNKTAFV